MAAALLLLLLALTGPAAAQAPGPVAAPAPATAPSASVSDPSSDPDPAIEATMDHGWALLHDLDYRAAMRVFHDLQLAHPELPRAYLYQAVVLWLAEMERRQDLEVSRFIDSSHFAEEDEASRDPEVRQRFEALLGKTEELLEARLAAAPADVDLLYLLGSVHGIRASFEATVGRDSSAALRAARDAAAVQRSVVEKDPYFYDAYLPLGVYDYVVGSLPFYLKWFAYLAGYRGDKPGGIRKIEQAASNGRRAARDARVILTVIYAREDRLEDALRLLHELAVDAPHNHVLRLNAAWCLYRLGRYREAADAYAEALRVARPAVKLRREDVRLMRALALLHAGLPAPALEIAEELLRDEVLAPDLRARAKLVRAHSLDALGRREEAVAGYREVLREKDTGGTRSAARRGVKTPFLPATPADLAAEATPAATPGAGASR